MYVIGGASTTLHCNSPRWPGFTAACRRADPCSGHFVLSAPFGRLVVVTDHDVRIATTAIEANRLRAIASNFATTAEQQKVWLALSGWADEMKLTTPGMLRRREREVSRLPSRADRVRGRSATSLRCVLLNPHQRKLPKARMTWSARFRRNARARLGCCSLRMSRFPRTEVHHPLIPC